MAHSGAPQNTPASITCADLACRAQPTSCRQCLSTSALLSSGGGGTVDRRPTDVRRQRPQISRSGCCREAVYDVAKKPSVRSRGHPMYTTQGPAQNCLIHARACMPILPSPFSAHTCNNLQLSREQVSCTPPAPPAWFAAIMTWC